MISISNQTLPGWDAVISNEKIRGLPPGGSHKNHADGKLSGIMNPVTERIAYMTTQPGIIFLFS